MIVKNIIISLRNLKRNMLSSFIGIFGFAIGFAISLIIGIYIYAEFNVDHHYHNSDSIFRLVDADKNSSSIDYSLNDVLKDNYASVQNSCPLEIQQGINADIYSSNYEPCYVKGLISTNNNFFEVFDIEIVRSVDYRKPFLDKNSSILTESAARKIFGENDPLGQAIKVSHMETVVSAVVKDFKSNASIHGQILLNSENTNFRLNNRWADGEIYSTTDHFIVLNDVDLKDDLEQALNGSLATYTKHNKTIYLQHLSNIYLNKSVSDSFKHGSKTLLIVLIIIGSLILLLSVVNYINYSLAIQVKKLAEVSIKKTNGAGLGNLLGGFLTDTTTWILISFSISILINATLIPVFNDLLQTQLSFDMLFNKPVIVGIGIILILIILISILPFLTILSKFNLPGGILKNNPQKVQKLKQLTFLTVFQLVVSIFLIVVLIGITNQINFVKQKDLGFNDNTLLHIHIPYKALNYESLKTELLGHSSIESASLSAGIPGNISKRMSHSDWKYELHFIFTDSDFLSTMGINLLKGRLLSPNDKNMCLVNEATLKALEYTDYREKKVNGKEIVGVVNDFNFSSLHQEIQPVILETGGGRDLSVRIRKGEIVGAMEYIKSVWKDMAHGVPLKYEFYDSWFDSMYKKEEQLGNAISVFAFVALIITCLGLLSQIFQITNSRTKEIGIRRVNGATILEILTMLNKDFIKWVAIAFVIACPIAYYAMNKWLENFAYKTTLSWWIFALAGVLALGIALLTVSWQSWKAATKNPVEALRYE